LAYLVLASLLDKDSAQDIRITRVELIKCSTDVLARFFGNKRTFNVNG